MEKLALELEALGKSIGLSLSLLDENGVSLGTPLESEIPPLVLALAKGTGSRSSTSSGLDIISILPIKLQNKELLVSIAGEMRPENGFDLLKYIVENLFEVKYA